MRLAHKSRSWKTGPRELHTGPNSRWVLLVWGSPEAGPETRIQCKELFWEVIPGSTSGGEERRRSQQARSTVVQELNPTEGVLICLSVILPPGGKGLGCFCFNAQRSCSLGALKSWHTWPARCVPVARDRVGVKRWWAPGECSCGSDNLLLGPGGWSQLPGRAGSGVGLEAPA